MHGSSCQWTPAALVVIVCNCVCIHMGMRAHEHVCWRTGVCGHVCMCTGVLACKRTCDDVYVCMPICMHVCGRVGAHACVRACVYLGHSLVQRERDCEALSFQRTPRIIQTSSEINVLENEPGHVWRLAEALEITRDGIWHHDIS